MKIVGFSMLNQPVSTKLNESDIRTLFPVLNKESIHGDSWKINVIKALQEGDVIFIEYTTSNAILYRSLFPLLLKKLLRNTMIEDNIEDRLSYNLIHTPDENEIEETLNYFHHKINLK